MSLLSNNHPKPTTMTLVGESAGGNLAAALAVKLVTHKLRKPDGLCLAYPCLNLSCSPGPSRIVHGFDPILPLGIMYAVLESYAGLHREKAFGAEKNPTMSPYHTPDSILEQFPRTHIMAGGFDPLLDDSVDFNTVRWKIWTWIGTCGHPMPFAAPLRPTSARLCPTSSCHSLAPAPATAPNNTPAPSTYGRALDP